jgi:hypothetical protein
VGAERRIVGAKRPFGGRVRRDSSFAALAIGLILAISAIVLSSARAQRAPAGGRGRDVKTIADYLKTNYGGP